MNPLLSRLHETIPADFQIQKCKCREPLPEGELAVDLVVQSAHSLPIHNIALLKLKSSVSSLSNSIAPYIQKGCKISVQSNRIIKKCSKVISQNTKVPSRLKAYLTYAEILKTTRIPHTLQHFRTQIKKLATHPEKRIKTLFSLSKNIKTLSKTAVPPYKLLLKSGMVLPKIPTWVSNFSIFGKVINGISLISTCSVAWKNCQKIAVLSKNIQKLGQFSAKNKKKTILSKKLTEKKFESKQALTSSLFKIAAKTAKIAGSLLSSTEKYQKLGLYIVALTSILSVVQKIIAPLKR